MPTDLGLFKTRLFAMKSKIPLISLGDIPPNRACYGHIHISNVFRF